MGPKWHIKYPQSIKSEKKLIMGDPGEFEGSLLFLIIFQLQHKKDLFFIFEGQLPLKQYPELAQYL